MGTQEEPAERQEPSGGGPQTSEGQEGTPLVLGTVDAIAAEAARAHLFDVVAQGKAEWERLFDAMGDGVALCRMDGHLLRANRSFAALFGTDVRRLPGSPC